MNTIDNSQISTLYKLFQNANNPYQLVESLAKQNPNLKPMLDLLKNGVSPKNAFEIVCKSKGLNAEQVITQIKSNIK